MYGSITACRNTKSIFCFCQHWKPLKNTSVAKKDFISALRYEFPKKKAVQKRGQIHYGNEKLQIMWKAVQLCEFSDLSELRKGNGKKV
jgi:hypothetical protein